MAQQRQQQQQQQQQPLGRGVSGLSEWAVVSEGELSSDGQHSLGSDESGERVIWSGRRGSGTRSVSGAAAAPSPLAGAGLFSSESALAVRGPSPRGGAGGDAESRHARLLAAVSDLASDPGLHRVATDIYGGSAAGAPIEQRLLDQIAELAEALDDSQEQAKLLLLHNDRLMTENDDLRGRLADVLRGGRHSAQRSGSERRRGTSAAADGEFGGDGARGETLRLSLAMAAGLLLISVAKKRLLLNPAGLLGAAFVGSCVGLYHLMQGAQENDDKPRTDLVR